jgi:hypothetical protein
MNNKKVLVEKKSGYNIWAEVNPVTCRLFNFSVSGVGVNPNHTHPYLSDAEKVVNKMVGVKS